MLHKKQLIKKSYDLKRDGLTQSIISAWCDCPQRFVYKTERWEGFQRDTTNFGTMVHDALEWLYNIKGRMPTSADVDCTLADFDDLNGMKAFVLLNEYLDIYKSDFTKKKFIDVEKVFDVYFNGVRLRGKFDGIFQAKDESMWIIEHKTKSQINEDDILLKLSFDFQNQFYLLCAEKLYNKSFSGILYNVIRNPTHKQGARENRIDFQKRLRKEVIDKPEYFFKRFEIPYTKKQAITFKEELTNKIESIERRIVYKNQGACSSPFRCSYLNACGTGKMAGYTQTKDPFSELKEVKE